VDRRIHANHADHEHLVGAAHRRVHVRHAGHEYLVGGAHVVLITPAPFPPRGSTDGVEQRTTSPSTAAS
jgi:hypothetical protein